MASKISGYDLGAVLGRGSRSVVYAAVHRASSTDVALKYLRVERAADREAARAEAELMRRLRHPSLIELLDVLENGSAVVLVLERAHGGSLAELLRRRGRLTPAETVATLMPVAEALSHAHDAGLLHRDVSASNILYSATGHAKLADLGVAGVAARANPGEVVVGTPAYLDPAVAAGLAGTEASDVFSLGAVGLHAVTGRPPWQRSASDDVDAVLRRAAAGDLHDLPVRLADCPPALGRALRRALDVTPSRRGDAADLAVALRAARDPGVPGARSEPASCEAVVLDAGRVRPLVVRRPVPGCQPEHPVRRRWPSRRSHHLGRHAAGRPDFVRAPFLDDGIVPVDLTRVAPTKTAGPLAADGPGRGRRRRRVRRLVAAFALLCAGVAVALLTLGSGPSDGNTSVAVTATPASSRVGTTAAPRPTAVPSAGRPVGAQAVAVLEHLDRVRSAAYAARDPQLLHAVYGSSALVDRDAAQLLAQVPKGCRLVGLTTAYRDVSVLRASPGAVVVRTTASVSGGRLQCPGSETRVVSDSPPTRLTFTLGGLDAVTAKVQGLAAA